MRKNIFIEIFNIATDDDDPDKYQKEQLKILITERQIDMLNASISRVAELAGQEFEVKSLAINDSDLNPKSI